MESEGVSYCKGSVHVFCNMAKFLSPLLYQFPCTSSHDTRWTMSSFLKGLCLGAHTGASSFIMSQDGTPQFVPLYLARS